MQEKRSQIKNESGFTLIELSVVILLLALISAFTMPIALQHSGYYLDSTARRLGSVIGYIRSQAASKKMMLRLNFDIEKRQYWVSTFNEDGEDVMVPFEMAKLTDLPRGVSVADVHVRFSDKINEGKAAIQFFPNGYVEGGVIHLKDDNEGACTILINPLTGRTKITDKYIEVENAFKELHREDDVW